MTPIACARRFYDAVARGDVPGVIDSLHPELRWTEAEGFPYFSGTWTSPQEVVEKLLVPLGRDWNGFAAKPDEFLAQGAVVITFGAYSGMNRATGKAMRAPFAHRWEVREDKLARFDMFTDTLLVDRAMR
jgi:ketosteroid isomerase-like protein